MKLRTANEGTKNRERRNQYEGEKERGREGGNIPSYNRMTPVIHIDDPGHLYG